MSLARPLTLGVAALGAVIALAGCGGGSDSLSADEFRSQADAICADANKQTDALAEPESNADLLPYLRAGLKVEAAQLSQLEDLKAPSDLEGTYSEALDLLKQKDAAITAAADRIEGGEDPEAVLGDVNDDIEALQDQAKAKAKDLGLTVCGTEDDGTSTTSTATTATAPATTTAPSTTAATGGTATPAAYLADVQVATTALQGFGELLQNSTSIEELGDNSAAAQAKLDEFDTAIAKLGTYKLAASQLDTQRAGLVATGPGVSDVLRRFVTAAAAGDIAALQKLVPEVTAAIGKFQAAATTTG